MNHESTMRSTSAVRPPWMGTARLVKGYALAGVCPTDREKALRSLVCAALADQSVKAIALGCGMDRSKVGDLLRGDLRMSTHYAERLACAANEPMRSALFNAMDALDRCVTREQVEALVRLGIGAPREVRAA